MSKNSDNLNRLEELKTKLSGKNYRMKMGNRENFVHPFREKVPESWDSPKKGDEEDLSEKFFSQTSAFKKFFGFSIIFFLLAGGFAAYTFFVQGNTISNNNIGISVLGNPFAAGGEPMPLQIEITNKNSSPLELSDLLVEYPKSTGTDLSANTDQQRINIGTIPAGGVRDENVSVTLYGEQGSVKPIKISLEYRVQGSNAIFVKEKDYQVSINSTPINLAVDSPSDISPNQNITFDIKASLNSTTPAQGILVSAEYPVGFQFESATPAPSYGNNVWKLGDLAPGTERNISVTGKMIGVASGEQKTFHVSTGSADSTDQSQIAVVFNSVSQTVNIQKPFIAATLYVNGQYQDQYAADETTPIAGEIHWANNTDSQINDMKIVARFSGSALDNSQISSPEGFYNSNNNTITWDRNSDSMLSQVAPSGAGVAKFSLSPLPLYSSNGLLASPEIRIDVSVSGQEARAGGTPLSLKNSDSKTVKIISDVGLSSQVAYSTGPFPNTGPIPPKVGQKTTYTVTWSITNTANNISKAEVKATLPPWVDYAGSASPPSEDFSYDPSSKILLWNIGNIVKGAGITGGSRQVSFQIEFTPSISQANTSPTLVNDATLTGHDDFANVDVTVNKTALNTNFSNDPAYPGGGGRVAQ